MSKKDLRFECGKIYDTTDSLLRAKQYKKVDDLLDSIDVDTLEVELCIAYISYTGCVQKHLSMWEPYFLKVFKKIEKQKGYKYAKECLQIFDNNIIKDKDLN